MRANPRPISWVTGVLAAALAAVSVSQLGCPLTKPGAEPPAAEPPSTETPGSISRDGEPAGPPGRNLTVGGERVLVGLYTCTRIHSRFLPLQVEPPLSEVDGSEPIVDGRYTRFWLLVTAGLEDSFLREYSRHIGQLPSEERLVDVGDGYTIGPVVHVCFRGLVSREGSFQKGHYKRMVRPLEVLSLRAANSDEIQQLRELLRRPTRGDLREGSVGRSRPSRTPEPEIDLTKHVFDRIMKCLPLFGSGSHSSE